MRTVFIHAIAILLVIAYTNMFVAWRFIGQTFGRAFVDVLPFLVVGLLFAAVAVFVLFRARRRTVSIAWPWLGAAIGMALIGLASTDPMFASKRIHVPQYAILAIVVWFSVRAADRTPRTLFLVFVAASLYGVHDEFLQGVHALRSFGLRDMVTDVCGVAAGVFFIRAIADVPVRSRQEIETQNADLWLVGGIAVVLAGVVLMALAGVAFRFDLVPYWTVLPALAAAFVLALSAERLDAPGDRAAVRAIVVVCLLFAVYPLVINVALLDFA